MEWLVNGLKSVCDDEFGEDVAKDRFSRSHPPGTENRDAGGRVILPIGWELWKECQMPNNPMNYMEVTEMASEKSFRFVRAHLVLSVPWMFHYPHCKDEKTEAQRGYLPMVK